MPEILFFIGFDDSLHFYMPGYKMNLIMSTGFGYTVSFIGG